MKRPQHRHAHMDGLAALLLFGVFAVCILSVLLTGADAYRRLTQRGQTSYDRRTTVQYLATRVRQMDRAGSVSVRAFEGRDALVLTEEIDGSSYETLVYYHDGYIRELFTAADSGAMPEDGETVIEAKGLRIYMDEPAENQLQFILQTGDGQPEPLTLYLRSGEEGAA